ncbi:MAG: hypothetical protein ACYC3I_00265 [Gemmataceae bacterium]
MKKLLPSAVLALVVSAGMTAQSFAGCCFGLFTNCCGCSAKFCVRQYNAFSPVCCGTVYCDGCCPFGSGGAGGGCAGGGPCMGALQYSGVLAPGCGGNGCADGACMGALPAADGAMGAPMATLPEADGAAGAPMATTLPNMNPIVSPAPLPSGPTSQLTNDRPILNATYRPAAYTPPIAVVPAPMQPQPMVAPSYWGN